jgi:hypothetical protein
MDFEGMDTTVRALLFGGLFLIALVVALWTAYDWQTQRRGGLAIALSILTGLGAILVLPAIVINAFNLDANDRDLIDPLSYLGIAGVAASAIICIAYALTRGEQSYSGEETQPMHPIIDLPDTDTIFDEEKPQERTQLIKRPIKRFAYLIMQNGPREGHPFELADVTNIGRSGRESNDIVLEDEAISAQHSRIRFDTESKQFVFHDLATTNGSWLIADGGKQRIEAPHVLSDGDIIEIGATRLVFKQMEGAAKS